MVADKLQAEAQAIAAEGWKWINVLTDLPCGYSHGLRRLVGDPAPLGAAEGATHANRLAEYRTLAEEYSGQDEYPDKIDARLGELETAMEAFEPRPLIFEPVEVARAGVFVTLDRDGSLAVYRGNVGPAALSRLALASSACKGFAAAFLPAAFCGPRLLARRGLQRTQSAGFALTPPIAQGRGMRALPPEIG